VARDAAALSRALADALAPQFRGRLLARGQAQSMIRRDGILPDDAPAFEPLLDDDLLGYGYALISTSLRILESADADRPPPVDEGTDVARAGLIQASYAIEAATKNARGSDELAFNRLIAGVASHLGGYAARAFSLVRTSERSGRLTSMEQVLAALVLRDLDRVEEQARSLRASPAVTDAAMLAALVEPTGGGRTEDRLREDPASTLGPIELLLTENYMSAVASALFALAHGLDGRFERALRDIQTGEQAAQEISAPGPWWVHRLTRHLLGDLSRTSIRAHVPPGLPSGAGAGSDLAAQRRRESRWRYLRATFVNTLFARSRSEIDLWPSQLHVVERIFATADDLVVALPTSAGKTRIAELCVLSCLAREQRAVYVTPLRALSAQTEQVLDRTFSPLGARVSSLYGSMGVSDVDEDALRTSEIVVATPEKLDFALRSDPTVLDDVGLVVLDEGHMIGPSEREVRYEAQIQRLLRRGDADARRIVCLSAVFPSGDDLDDFVAWVTDDAPEGLHREDWRPTQQRFGLVEWRGDHARLSITLGQDRPFIPRYVEAAAPTGRRKKSFPSDQRELVIATAYRLVEEGQTVLIFCPQRNSVEPYARELVRLRNQGLVRSLLPEGVDLANALAVGAEWFGSDHPILECLRLGVAIHHGALPAPFRREVERLLHDGAIRVTVASPTLAQGLNLSASVVLFHALRRGQTQLTGAEFSNVIGRAGRAFVDTEGLVLYPVFEPTEWRRREWLALTEGEGGKALRSGLIEIGIALIRRVVASTGSADVGLFIDFITGPSAWAVPVVAGETQEQAQEATRSWQSNLALLDTGILSIIGDVESDSDAVTQLLSDLLRDSLWERQLRRADADTAAALREVVTSRARYVWRSSTPAQRRGWYLAGVGAEAGVELAGAAGAIINMIAETEAAVGHGDIQTAARRLESVAVQVFALVAFRPENPLPGWRVVFRHWVNGRPLGDLDVDRHEDRVAVAQFVETELIYRLVWGMEAARAYELAQGSAVAEALTGTAVMAVETGTFLRPASILIRSGFDHRAAAIRAVRETAADFDSTAGMRLWIRALDPAVAGASNWPTAETNTAWRQFASRAGRPARRRWTRRSKIVESVNWSATVPSDGDWLRVTPSGPDRVDLWSPGFDRVGDAEVALDPHHDGVLYARKTGPGNAVTLHSRGPRRAFGPAR
jgi:superfamily II DNA/RNA helicase